MSNNQQSSLPELNADKENGYHRMTSNPTAAFGTEHSKISHEYDSSKHQQRRQSFSHHPSSYARDTEMPISRGGEDPSSYKKMGEIPDHYSQQHQQNYRPGEMRYTQDEQQEFRD